MAAMVEKQTNAPAGRMIVFVPENLENVAEFARQVYNLAHDEQRWVLYLSLKPRAGEALAESRQLATLTALTRGDTVRASAIQARMPDWLGALTDLARPGDLVILPEERQNLPAELERGLGITRQWLPGYHETVRLSRWADLPWLKPVVFWLIGLLLVVGFSFLDFRLGSLFHGGGLKAALIAAFTIELFLLYQWNRIFR